MALVKSVEIDIGVKGDQDSKAKLDAISARAEELKKAFPEYTLKIDSLAASQRLAVFKADMKSVADQVNKPMDPVVLTDKAKSKLLEIQAKAEELKARFPEFTLRIDDSAAKRKLAIFAAEAKATTDIVDTELAGSGSGGGGGLFSKLGRLFSGSGGSGSGSPSGSPASGLLSSPAGLTVAAGGVGLGAALLPGVAGLGIGGAAGLGGVGLVALLATQAAAVIKLDQAQVKAAKSGPALAAANKQLAADMKANSPFIAITADIKGLLTPLQQIMTPFAKALDPIIKSFGSGLAALGPQMTAMFKASLPFVQMFATLMLKMGATLMPAFTQAMTTMVKSGALKEMTQGLVILIQGFAKFVVALGPGMKASAMIFRDLMVIVAAALQGAGKTISWIANVVEDFAHRWRVQFDRLTTTLDSWRHDFSAVFMRVNTDLNNWRHNTAVIFDGVRHDIAAAWDAIWKNTVTRVQNGIRDVITWFRGIPGRAVSALTGLGHSLAAFARSAIGEMWTGFKNTFSTVIHWFEGLPKMILHALGIHSPPSWAIDAGKHIMAGLHIGLGHGLGQLTSFTTSIGAQVAAGLSGALGGGMGDSGARTHSAAVAQAYASSLLSQYGWSQSQMSSLVPLWNQESGWSAYAVNQSSGAYGIPQSLGHGHPYALGDYKNQIIWGLNYIRQRYGSPAAAEAHERAFNWYGGGLDAIFSQPTVIGVGERGPEHVQVTPGGRGGGNTYNITVHVPPSANQAEIGRHLVTAIGAFEQRSGKGWRK